MKRYVLFTLLIVLSMLFVACAPATPQVVEKEVVVEKPVIQTVVVEKEVPVEKVVKETIVVEKEVLVTPTAEPTPGPLEVKEGGTINLWMELAPPHLYVPTATDRSSFQIFELVYDMLLDFSDELEIVPDLAESYEISDDGLEYTVHLSPGVTWHDGEPFTAEDVKFTYTAFCGEGSIYLANYKNIVGAEEYNAGEADEVEGIQIVDDMTVKFVLETPSAAFLSKLAGQNVVPAHIFQGLDLDTAVRTAWEPVGTGPFKFVQYQEDQFFEFEANPNYFRGKPHIDKAFVTIAKVDTAIAMLEKGEIDYITDLPATEFARVSTLPNVQILEIPNDSWPWLLEFNISRDKFEDVRVRQAFMYAIDRQAYVDSILEGHGTVVNHPFTMPGWAKPDDSEINLYPYDPEKAKELLEEAGWDPDEEVEILYYPGNKLRDQFAVIAQQYLTEVGVKVNVVAMDVARAVEKFHSGEFDILLSGAGMDPDASYNEINFACENTIPQGGNNGGFYCNEEVDALFEQGANLYTVEERAPIYQSIAKILNEEAPWVYICTPNYLSAVSTRINNMHFNPNIQMRRYLDIHEWMLAQ